MSNDPRGDALTIAYMGGMEQGRRDAQATQAHLDNLARAARAVIAQWDTPNWKLPQPTGELIEELRRALEALP